MKRETFEVIFDGYHAYMKIQGWPTPDKESIWQWQLYSEVLLAAAKLEQEKKSKKGVRKSVR